MPSMEIRFLEDIDQALSLSSFLSARKLNDHPQRRMPW